MRRTGRRTMLATVAAAALVAGTVVAVHTSPPAAAAETTLRAAATQAGLFFGVAANPNRLSGIVNQEFGQLTPENAMKPDTLATSSGGLQNTGGADTLVNYAAQNNMLVKGHTMVWHSQAGALQGSNQNTLNNFIGNALLRWGNRVQYWDVVNEAFEDNNTGRRRTQWPHTISRDANGDGDVLDAGDTDVIRDSFRRAKQVVQQNNLTTKLCINDYDVEGLTVQGGARNNKAQALYETVRAYTQSSEKLIDCVGFQAHFNDNPNSIISNDLQANIQRFADLGVEVHISELDIDDDLSNNDIGQGQAENYRKVVRACLNVSMCKGITVWGIADSESWRASERGLLFTGGNGNYQKKAAYYAVLEELNRGRNPDSPTSPPTSSSPSNPPSDPPSDPPPPAGCSATASLNSWNGGFVATVRVTAGSSAINQWTVTANLPGGAAVTNVWNADRSGTSGTVRFGNVNYNGRIGAGQSTEFGFQGTGSAEGLTVACSAS
ncbi:endo-1,4-beta-xylanase [Paractinoplanes brasiliensis]|uniref:Beta-xylanase n=1 Tax=Paractinoplanes brasiliensis TaxID=52695 RepID=A0A4R6JLE4_9ACTN|nr:endo-1,4-beta-xylanase [Actinoplanes brasiliensis]TDO36949.1 endo-1,4-beta-xylanase [Actinoplanes brasiliensis]GID30471.1 beta-xylanase [Actinoplanes brasiliensis]